MLTLILPGYSPSNYDWAKETKSGLRVSSEVVIWEWEHWKGGLFNLDRETGNIIKLVGKGDVKIIAKSVGTRVAMKVLIAIGGQVEKLILCGIPTKTDTENLSIGGKNLDTEDNLCIQGLSKIDPAKVLIIQNDHDPLVTFTEIKKFIGASFSEIKFVKGERSDHHYPYTSLFNKFLSED